MNLKSELQQRQATIAEAQQAIETAQTATDAPKPTAGVQTLLSDAQMKAERKATIEVLRQSLVDKEEALKPFQAQVDAAEAQLEKSMAELQTEVKNLQELQRRMASSVSRIRELGANANRQAQHLDGTVRFVDRLDSSPEIIWASSSDRVILMSEFVRRIGNALPNWQQLVK